MINQTEPYEQVTEDQMTSGCGIQVIIFLYYQNIEHDLIHL